MNYSSERQTSRLPSWLVSLKRGWYIVAITCLVGAAGGLLMASISAPVYSSTATLYASSSADEVSSASAYQGSLASEQRVASYTELAKSSRVLERALGAAGTNWSLSNARDALEVSATPDTVLLDISARSGDPGQAALLANSVAESLAAFVSRLEAPSQQEDSIVRLSVVSPAVPADSPVSPRLFRSVILGVIVGVSIGVLFVVARSRFSDRIFDGSDVADSVDLPVLAEIPSDPVLRSTGTADLSSGWSPAGEAYRKLRTGMAYPLVDADSRTVLVTSSGAAEGKTATALSLGAAFAEAGSRVLVIDADLRRPQVGQRSELGNSFGLTNWLRGDAALGELVMSTGVSNLSVLAAGSCPPNPSELLESKRMKSGLEEMASVYDYVIIDSPPVSPVADAVVLSKIVSTVLVVVRAGSTRIRDLNTAVGELGLAGASLAGVVLTDVKMRDKSRYTYYDSVSSDLSPESNGAYVK